MRESSRESHSSTIRISKCLLRVRDVEDAYVFTLTMQFGQASLWLKLDWSYANTIVFDYASSLTAIDLDADFGGAGIKGVFE